MLLAGREPELPGRERAGRELEHDARLHARDHVAEGQARAGADAIGAPLAWEAAACIGAAAASA